MPPVVPPLPTRRRKQHEVPDIPPDTAATALQSRYRGRLVRKGTVDQRKVIEAWLSSQPTSLVVWDFDQTVLRIHAFARGVRAEQVADRWERDVADKQFFTGFALAARERGIEVGIASFGRNEVVQAYMREIFREHGEVFRPSFVVTPASIGHRDGSSVPDGKPRMLKLLRERCDPPITDKASVLFFDDDGNNVEDCLRSGYRAVHTPRAFTRLAMANAASTQLPGGDEDEQFEEEIVDLGGDAAALGTAGSASGFGDVPAMGEVPTMGEVPAMGDVPAMVDSDDDEADMPLPYSAVLPAPSKAQPADTDAPTEAPPAPTKSAPADDARVPPPQPIAPYRLRQLEGRYGDAPPAGLLPRCFMACRPVTAPAAPSRAELLQQEVLRQRAAESAAVR